MTGGNRLQWLVVCIVLGMLGTYALLVPLFGFLSYIGALVFPLFVLAEIGFGLAAVTVRGRWRRSYVLGNLGLVLGYLVVYVSGVAVLIVNPRWQPDTSVSRPVFFGVVLMGLAAGITMGVLRTAPGRD